MTRLGANLRRTVVAGLLAVILAAHGSEQAFGQSGSWTTKASMPTARCCLGVGVVNGILYAVGGIAPGSFNTSIDSNTVEAYDPSANTWTTVAPMPTARKYVGVGVVNGILYAVGGGSGNSISNNLTILNTVEAYDPSTNTWTPKAPMPTARAALGVGVVNGILYAVGGANIFTGGFKNAVEAYDPSTNTWTPKAPMSTARSTLGVGVANGILYAVGGVPGSNTVEAYDPSTNTWTTVAPMPTARADVGVGVANGILYAVGGILAMPFLSAVLNTAEAYDPSTNTWTTVAPMPTARADVGVGVANGILYAVGGASPGTSLSTNEALAVKPDPVLTVPHWFQVGIPLFSADKNGFIYNNWGQMQLDTETPFNSISIGNRPLGLGTIARNGCALTALTMVYNFWAGNKQSPPNGTTGPPYPGVPPANPQNPDDKTVLNNAPGLFLSDNSGQVTWSFALWNQNQSNLVKMYQACPGSSCNNTFPVLPSPPSSPDPTQTLVNILRNQVPVILPIQCNPTLSSKCNSITGNPKEIHWVVVTGWNSQLGTFLVNDPGDITVDTLNYTVKDSSGNFVHKGVPDAGYAGGDGITQLTVQNSLNNINAWKVYTKVTNPLVPMDPITPQALGVYSNAPVELILTDPQGRRTGFDPVTNTSFQDIPTSDYETSAYCDELGSSGCNSPFKTLEMANQILGQYTLDVIGTGSGAFTISVRASDPAGNWITQTYTGTTAPGLTSRIAFQGAVTTFAAFAANLAISPSHQAFGGDGTFALGPGGTISPMTQPVTIQIGNGFLVTIPAGSFEQTPQGTFVFGGVIQGVLLAAGLTPTGGNSYAFAIAGAGAPNLPSANPVDVRISIGSNGGSTSANATFVP